MAQACTPKPRISHPAHGRSSHEIFPTPPKKSIPASSIPFLGAWPPNRPTLQGRRKISLMQHAQTPSKPQIPRLRRKKKKATAELASEKISLPVSPLRPHPLPLFPQTRLRSTRGCTLLPTPILSPFVASARTTPNTTAATRAPLQVCPTSSSSSARARGGGLADGRHGTARSKGRANRAEKREKRAAQKKKPAAGSLAYRHTAGTHHTAHTACLRSG